MRPKSFNEDEVLRAIEATFRRVGYDGASLDVLTRDTGLNRSSLYNAFGCKNDMMRLAVSSYTDRSCEMIRDVLAIRPFKDALRTFFSHVAAPESQGCLVGNLIAERAEGQQADRSFLGEREAELEAGVAQAFAAAQRDGEIDASADADEFSRYIMAIVQGLRILSQAGDTPDAHQSVVETALNAIPFTGARR